MTFSDLEKRALEVFVTSADDSIYAIRHTVPPEVFGAFGSYFSRNPKDFREHLLDAIKGTIDEGKGLFDEKGNPLSSQEALRWIAEKSNDPALAIKTGLAKAQDFFKKWYGGYSHKSIANVVWIPVVANGVSQLFAKELAYDQLAFFIEQSTRFVVFDVANLYKDIDVMNSRHRDSYMNALEKQAVAYKDFIGEAVNFYGEQIPFSHWREMQTSDILNKPENEQKIKYERELKAKALDVARFLLPQATRTNIAWILDARSTEFDIAAWKGHPLAEMREDANLIEKHAGQIAPSLLKYTAENSYYGDKLNGYGRNFKASPARAFEKGVDIISYDPNSLDNFLAVSLKRHNAGGTFSQRMEQLKKLSFTEKIERLRRMTEKRNIQQKGFDEWVDMGEDFDLENISFEIRTDIGAVRDWRRHQKWNRSEAIYSLDNGFHKPYMLAEMSRKAKQLFDDSMQIAHDAERKIRADFPYQAQYVIPMAANHAIAMSGGLDQLQYILYTRSTPQGNFSYRMDAFNIAEAVVRVHPWMLGYEKYPEGKSFDEVYREAPLKTLLKLQTGETSLHQ